MRMKRLGTYFSESSTLIALISRICASLTCACGDGLSTAADRVLRTVISGKATSIASAAHTAGMYKRPINASETTGICKCLSSYA